MFDIFEGLGRDEIVVKENVVLEDETSYGSSCKVFGGEGSQGEDTVIRVVWNLADCVETLYESEALREESQVRIDKS